MDRKPNMSDGIDDPDKNLTRRATTSSIWMIAARLIVRFSDLLLLMLLTRLLTPEDFGLVAIAASIVAILDVVTDLPLATPLVRLEKPTKAHMDTALALGAIRGLLIFGVALLLAGPLALFFGDERLMPLLLVLAGASSFYTFRSPQMAVLFKQLRFRPSFIVEAAGSLAGVLSAVVGAFMLESYWALTISPCVSRVSKVLLSYYFAPYRPGLSLREWRYFWEFLGWMIPSQFIIAVSWQFDRLFLARVIPINQMGLYSLSSNVNSILEQTVSRAVSGPLISGFVLAKDDAVRLRRGYLLADSTIFNLGAPAYLATFCLADPLVRLAFGQSWIEAAPYLGGLALAMLPALIRIPFRPLAMAVGHTRFVFLTALWSLALRIPAVAGGFVIGGIEGVIWGIGFANIGNAAIAMYYVRRTLGSLSVADQLSANGRVLLALVPLFALTWWAGMRMTDMETSLQLFGAFAATVVAAAALHAISVLTIWQLAGRPEGFEARFLGAIRKRFAVLRPT